MDPCNTGLGEKKIVVSINGEGFKYSRIQFIKNENTFDHKSWI